MFEDSRIALLLQHFEVLLGGIVSEPESRVSRLPLLTESERHELTVARNDTRRDYPRDASVTALVERHEAERPDAVAVVWGSTTLTYSALDHRANQLARLLRGHGVERGAHVALAVERGPNLIVGMLAILKAGGAYVPLDPEYSQERLAFVFEDTAPPVLLTEGHLTAALPPFSGRVICFDDDAASDRH